MLSKKVKIFVAGHNGMVGKSILRQLTLEGFTDISIASRSELDLRNSNDVANWFKREKPDVTILAAAKVGGIIANDSSPTEFLLDNLKIQNNIIESSNEIKSAMPFAKLF